MNITLLQKIDKATHLKRGDTVTPIKSVWKAIGMHLAVNSDAHGVCAYSPPAAIAACTRKEHSRIRREIRAIAALGGLTRKSGAGGNKKAYTIYTLHGAVWVEIKERVPRGAAHGVPRGAAHGVPGGAAHGVTVSTSVKASVVPDVSAVEVGKGGQPDRGNPAVNAQADKPHGVKFSKADVRAVGGLLKTLNPKVDGQASRDLLTDVWAHNRTATGPQVLALITQELVSMKHGHYHNPVGWVLWFIPRCVDTTRFDTWAAEYERARGQPGGRIPRFMDDNTRAAMLRTFGAKERKP